MATLLPSSLNRCLRWKSPGSRGEPVGSSLGSPLRATAGVVGGDAGPSQAPPHPMEATGSSGTGRAQCLSASALSHIVAKGGQTFKPPYHPVTGGGLSWQEWRRTPEFGQRDSLQPKACPRERLRWDPSAASRTPQAMETSVPPTTSTELLLMREQKAG